MKKYLYIWILPLVWAIVSFISYKHPGDEYALYAISSLPGVWLAYFVKSVPIQNLFFPVIIALIGGLVMALLGFSLHKLSVNSKHYYTAFAVCIGLIVLWFNRSFPSVEKLIAKNGSWTACIAFAVNTSLYLSAIFALVIALIYRSVKKLKF
jgi:hypothetical protein